MEDNGTEIVVRLRVEFSEEEYDLLKAGAEPTQELNDFIHDVVMRSLRRKQRKVKDD